MSDKTEFSVERRERANCGVGAVVDLNGQASHQVLRDGLSVLERLDHRGARGAEENTGDGAGVILQKPDGFFRQQVEGLPNAEFYAVGQLFVPRDAERWQAMRTCIESVLVRWRFELVAWREVPTCNDQLGRGALDLEPRVVQLFIQHADGLSGSDLDRRCYVLRLALEKAMADKPEDESFHVCSLERRRIVYKGLLTNPQLSHYYPDLADPAMQTTLAITHSRFSTNTLGSWDRAHPHRVIAHNGEINTYRANFNRLRDREVDLDHPDIGNDLAELRPLVESGVSDTELLDAVLDLLMAGGRSLTHALRMVIPQAWQKDPDMDEQSRAWYDFHANLMEPWDGPALVVGTDGERVVAALDRNGFRPCRYDITYDGRLVLSSEAGVLDYSSADIKERGRVGPGEMIAVDPQAGGLIDNETLRRDLNSDHYGEWLKHRPRLADVAPPRAGERATNVSDLESRQRAAGYTYELVEHLLQPLAEDGKDALGAMGDDASPSVLSDHPRSIYSYFKQLFAQVSNPPIDYLRESLVTSLQSNIGPQRNLLSESPDHCRRIHLDSPLLTNGELASLRGLQSEGFTHRTLDITYDPQQSLREALEALCSQAEAAVNDGCTILVLSDRASSARQVAIPGLMGVGAVHQHLLECQLRLRVALVAEISDACAVHHMCTLFGYGVDAVNPYLAMATVASRVSHDKAIVNYLAGLEDGLLKVMSKMGISTLESYKGSQLFEALGLAPEVISTCFAGSISRIGGCGFAQLEANLYQQHQAAWTPPLAANPVLDFGGEYYWRRHGETHDWDPDTLGLLQAAVRTNDEQLFRTFSQHIDNPEDGPRNLRSLLAFKSATAISQDTVEPAEALTRRFFSGAMSLGALSPEAHEAIAIGMNRVGATAHSGEGGEQPERFGTERECRNKQVASGRFGVTAPYLAAAEQIEIKMSQGAKPGEGGQLPGEKVFGLIAQLRFMTPGVPLISPPPHHDIYSIEDLAQLIHDLRAASPKAAIHVKLVAAPGVGTIAAGVVKAGADTILISGDAGGTGAATKTSIKSAGLPWELGLAEAQQVLVANRLRSRVTLRVDGGLKTARDVVVAALLGAEEYGFGMSAVVAVGCIMLRKCHCNTCSVGIATQDPELRKLFPGDPEHIANYMRFVAADIRGYLAQLGASTLDEVIGQVELLEQIDPDIAGVPQLDLDCIVQPPSDADARRCEKRPQERASDSVDAEFIERARPALEQGQAVTIEDSIDNRHRSIGTRLSYWLTQKHGSQGLADATLRLRLKGVAGQSLGAFVNCGLEVNVTGAANDYVGKGLSGGRIILRVPSDAGYDADQSIILGNAALYGATTGEFYARGISGERFGVRNSGAVAVVEGCGDHPCEYMTGGTVMILGDIGRNLAAGMSGGEIYLHRSCQTALDHLDRSVFQIGDVDEPRDLAMAERLLRNHAHHTDSDVASALLANWPESAANLCKVTPINYANVIAENLAEGRDLRTPLPKAAIEVQAVEEVS
ncbi:glutamate synthase large subunit [Salinisphaera sp. USBA-960]|uniref:glutamate synthase large subunit n=1 Tax=Salinisphaera orenii TaxID=856731 RepID=UPI000DBE836B|nr:glutamate synthase large subunit [Salifodinibacter halophilus]NNC25944.1 glutamate synthase large subunit [Salifodinibacter halophilus]